MRSAARKPETKTAKAQGRATGARKPAPTRQAAAPNTAKMAAKVPTKMATAKIVPAKVVARPALVVPQPVVPPPLPAPIASFTF